MKKAKRRNIGSLWREEVNYLQSYDGQIDAAELLEEVEAQFTADLEEFFGERVSWAYWVNPKEKGRPPKESPAQPAMRGLLSFLHWLQDGLAGISLSPAAATGLRHAFHNHLKVSLLSFAVFGSKEIQGAEERRLLRDLAQLQEKRQYLPNSKYSWEMFVEFDALWLKGEGTQEGLARRILDKHGFPTEKTESFIKLYRSRYLKKGK